MTWQPIPLWDDDTWADAAPAPSPPVATRREPTSAPPPEVSARVGAGPIGVFDLETTGVDVREDRIVTAHVGLLDAAGSVVSARSWLAHPGVAIPEGATAVHGITTAHAQTHGRPARDVVAEVTATLRDLFDRGIPVVAYNAPFDFSMLKYEGLRHGVPPIAAPSPVIDPLVIDKTYDRYRRGKRTLEVVAAHYAVTLDGAHDAAADAVAAGRVAQAIAARFGLETTPADLHEQQISWARAQAESLTEYFVKIGRLDPEDALDSSWPIR